MSKVYSDEDLCEYTVMQQIQALQKQLDELKASVGAGLETKEEHDKDISDVRSDLDTETSLLHAQFTKGLAEANANIENVNKVVPTDLGVKDGKLGLLHDTKWLTNQGAIGLGSGLTYDSTKNEISASGGDSIPVVEGTLDEENYTFTISDSLEGVNYFILHFEGIGYIFMQYFNGGYVGSATIKINDTTVSTVSIIYNKNNKLVSFFLLPALNYFKIDESYLNKVPVFQDEGFVWKDYGGSSSVKTISVSKIPDTDTPQVEIDLSSLTDEDTAVILDDGNSKLCLQRNLSNLFSANMILKLNKQLLILSYATAVSTNTSTGKTTWTLIYTEAIMNLSISDADTPTDPIKQISLFGNHSILVPSDSSDSNIDLYTHNIVMEADSGESYLYLTIISSNNLVVDSLTDLNTLLSTTVRDISCSGTKFLDSVYYSITSIHWEGNVATTKTYITYTDSTNGEDTAPLSDFASIKDVVTTL